MVCFLSCKGILTASSMLSGCFCLFNLQLFKKRKKKKDLEVFIFFFLLPMHFWQQISFLTFFFLFFFSDESSKGKNVPASRTTQEPTLISLFSLSQVLLSQTAIQKTLSFSARSQYHWASFLLFLLCCHKNEASVTSLPFFQDKTPFVAERTVQIWWCLAQLLCPADSWHKQDVKERKETGFHWDVRCSIS